MRSNVSHAVHSIGVQDINVRIKYSSYVTKRIIILVIVMRKRKLGTRILLKRTLAIKNLTNRRPL
jgi:hypothetical protein